MASGTQNLTSYKARYLAGGIAEVQQHLNVTGTTYFSAGTSVTDGKPILAYNSANANFGLRYFESSPDVLTISASGNNNSKTGADFSINGLGDGILSHLGNYIPHTGNTTGTVGDDSRPVYVNAGTITQVNTPNSGAWFTGVPQVRSDGVMEIGKYIDWHHEDTTTKDYSVRMTAGDGTLTISGTTYGTFNGSLTGNATTASALAAYASIGNSTTDHGVALKNWFTANKSTAPRNQVISFYSSTSGNGSQYMGYFLSGYADNPYGGFFVCHYNNPYYVGIQNGTYTQQHILTSTNYTTYTVTKTGSGASGTWGISITGNAATASKITDITSTDAASSSAHWRRIWISYGNNVTGRPAYTDKFAFQTSTGSMKTGRIHIWPEDGSNSYNEGIRIHSSSGKWATIMLCGDDNTGDTGTSTKSWGIFNNDGTLYINKATSSGAGNPRVYANANGWYFTKAYGAVWNDFAEYRKVELHEPGYAVAPSGHRTCNRLESGARITSDTYGYAIGYMEDREDLMPVAISGRVLAYPLYDKSYYEVGDAVCAAEGGKVDKMTREEIMMYPDRILGIVNEIPDYDIWEPSREGGGHEPIHTNGRIWIDIR